jgi:hypothetical protein
VEQDPKRFSNSDVSLETIQEKTDRLVDKVEEALPEISGGSVCERLKNKPRNQWTQNDWRLWDRYGCR